MKLARFVVMSGVAALLWASGAEAVMCVKKSGVVVVRDACRKRETPVSTTQFVGAQGEDGADGARGERGEKGESGELRVVDSTGRFVGFVDIGHADTIAVVAPGAGLGLLYSDEDGKGFYRYESPNDVTFYHLQLDCAGDIFIQPSRYSLVPWAPVTGDYAYFPQIPGSPQPVLSKSYPAESCATTRTQHGLCCESFADFETKFVARVTPVPVASLGTPPFRVDY